MVRNDRIFCYEAQDVSDPMFRAVERLYESTQHPDERIPWGWIARSLKGKSNWKPGTWGRHLLVAAPSDRPADPDHLAGFAYGTHIPGYGGYVSYLGVAEGYRRKGVGARLFQQMFKLLAADAGVTDEPLPFVVWESHRPGLGASNADLALWDARTRLFDRVGGAWIDGLELMTPNYGADEGDPVPLQLFVKPVDRLASSFDPADLRGIATGLLERVYKLSPEDRLVQAVAATDPRLRPARRSMPQAAMASVAVPS